MPSSLRSKFSGWRSTSFIVGAEMMKRFSYHGIGSNLLSYLTAALEQSTAATTMNLNVWYGTAALTPILGALVAGSYLGRYWTVTLSSLFISCGVRCFGVSLLVAGYDEKVVVLMEAYKKNWKRTTRN